MGVEEIKKTIIDKYGNKYADRKFWGLIEKKIPENMVSYLDNRAGPANFASEMPNIFSLEKLSKDEDAQLVWVMLGNFYKNIGRKHEAISIYSSLYDRLLLAQIETNKHLHKGEPLVWISDCFRDMGFPVLAKRFLMLTLCEDSIRGHGIVSPDKTGVYFRLVWQGGLTDKELNEYASEIYRLSKNDSSKSLFPEWILQNLNKNWMTEIPSPSEANVYFSNTVYINKLLNELEDKTGKVLETLAEYILSCMPGCRTKIRTWTVSSEIDIVCSMEGIEADFRSEMGRYFICECKDLDNPVDYTYVAKFCRVLDSIKSKFGILFSPNGISGKKNDRYAANEPQKLFQNNGIVLVVIDRSDLEYVANKGNFINLLREKYERVRLDLPAK